MLQSQHPFPSQDARDAFTQAAGGLEKSAASTSMHIVEVNSAKTGHILGIQVHPTHSLPEKTSSTSPLPPTCSTRLR